MEIKIDPKLRLFLSKKYMENLAKDLCEVQPMSKEVGEAFLVLSKPRPWSIPDNNRPVFQQDDITVLLIMGYKITHTHNCCTGFGGKYRAPMTYWILPDEVFEQESCEHDWEVNFR